MNSATRITVAAALALLTIPATTDAVGVIRSGGADLQPGDAAVAGTVTIDPAYPIAAAPFIFTPDAQGTIGTMTGSLPSFPGGGTGADGAYVSGANATLAAGTYNFTSFTVSPGAGLTVQGTVTILVTGNVFIGGSMFTNYKGGSITIHCAGDFTMAGGPAATTNYGLGTLTPYDSVEVIAGGDVRIGNPVDDTTRTMISAYYGGVTVVGTGASKAFVIGNGFITSIGGAVRVQAPGAMTIAGLNSQIQTSLNSDVTQVLVQAFGGSMTVDKALIRADGTKEDLLVEASQRITLTGNARIQSAAGPSARVTAFGGDLSVTDSSITADAGGACTVLASGKIKVADGSLLSTEFGALRLVAFGGDVQIQKGDFAGSGTLSSSYGDLLVSASANVFLGPRSSVSTFGGRADIDAFGDVRITGDKSVQVGSHLGDLEIVAGGDIAADTAVPAGPDALLSGGAVRIYASGGIDLDDIGVRSYSNDIHVVSVGALRARKSLHAFRHLYVESAEGNIDIDGGILTTDDDASPPAPQSNSGFILVWSHRVNGTIDATGATLRTGDSPGTSGSISLLGKGVDYSPVEGFILPAKIAANYNAFDPQKSRLTASGILDTGTEEANFFGPATVDVGDRSFEVPGFVPKRSGTVFSYRGDGLTMEIFPSGAGSGRAVFRLVAVGDLFEAADLEESITLRFANQDSEGSAVVDLDKGRFTLGRKPGAVAEPNLSLQSAKAALAGGGNDALTLRIGFSTDGTVPEAPQDLVVGFGGFEATIPGEAFVADGNRFVFKGAAAGVTQVILDYRKETILIKATGVDLGEYPEGASAVPIRVNLGGEERIVTVRMGRKGPALVY